MKENLITMNQIINMIDKISIMATMRSLNIQEITLDQISSLEKEYDDIIEYINSDDAMSSPNNMAYAMQLQESLNNALQYNNIIWRE